MGRRLHVLAAMCSMLMLAACGGAEPITAGGGTDQTPGAPGDSTAAAADGTETAPATGWDQLYAEIDGLEGEERTNRLVELAQEAGGVIQWYGTMNGEEGIALVDAFTERYGLAVDFYRAPARQVAQRTIQEHAAGYANSADVISANGTEMVILDREGVLAEFQSPLKGEYPEHAIEGDGRWVWHYVNYYTPVWNTDLVSPEEQPQDWMDVLTDFGGGRCALESKAYGWLATLIPHLMETQGFTEDEAIDVVRNAAAGCAAAVSGNTVVTTLVAAGQYDIVLAAYHISARQRQDEGAPIAWIEPPAAVFGQPNGFGLNAIAPNPAGGLLFAEYALGQEGAEVIAEFGRTVAHPDVELGSIDPAYEVVPVPLESVIDEADRWQTLYDELNALTSSGVVEQ